MRGLFVIKGEERLLIPENALDKYTRLGYVLESPEEETKPLIKAEENIKKSNKKK